MIYSNVVIYMTMLPDHTTNKHAACFTPHADAIERAAAQ